MADRLPPWLDPVTADFFIPGPRAVFLDAGATRALISAVSSYRLGAIFLLITPEGALPGDAVVLHDWPTAADLATEQCVYCYNGRRHRIVRPIWFELIERRTLASRAWTRLDAKLHGPTFHQYADMKREYIAGGEELWG